MAASLAGSIVMLGCTRGPIVLTGDIADLTGKPDQPVAGTISFAIDTEAADGYTIDATRSDIRQLRFTLYAGGLATPLVQTVSYPTTSVTFTSIPPGLIALKVEALDGAGEVLGVGDKTGIQVVAGQQTAVKLKLKVGPGFGGRVIVGVTIGGASLVPSPAPVPSPVPSAVPSSVPTAVPTPGPNPAPTFRPTPTPTIAPTAAPSPVPADPASVVQPDLFSLNINNLEWGTVWPTIPLHSWRTFHSQWSYIQPKSRSEWDWTRMDLDVSLGEQHGVESLLVLSKFAPWVSALPSGTTVGTTILTDWRNYVRTIATRYKGRVHLYELWNEPSDSFSGSVEQLVELSREAYQTIKSVDPTATVVSPAVENNVNYVESYLAKGGGQWCDVFGFHYYVAPRAPEAIQTLRGDNLNAVLKKYGINKPIWNTETGWRIINHDKNYDLPGDQWAGPPLSDADSMAYIARSYLISWVLGVKRLYWYAWGNATMGLTEDDRKTPKPIATAYVQVRDWMLGAQSNSRTVDASGNWIYPLTRSGGYQAWAVWNPTATISFSVPAAWGIKQKRDLYGNRQPFAGVASAQVGSLPILLENQAR